MKKRVYFNKTKGESCSGKITIPKDFLEYLDITKSNPTVNIELVDGQIIISKYEKEKKDI